MPQLQLQGSRDTGQYFYVIFCVFEIAFASTLYFMRAAALHTKNVCVLRGHSCERSKVLKTKPCVFLNVAKFTRFSQKSVCRFLKSSEGVPFVTPSATVV